MSRFKKILALILLSGFLLAPVLTFANGAARFGYSNTGTTTPPSTESASKFNDSGGCDLIMYTGNNVFVSCTAAKISAFLLSLAADLVYRAGTMFDFSIDYSLNMATRLGEFKFVSNGWGVLRDVTNLAYIFILLYISINIILGNSGYGDKSLIAKVLITAVFVNFSLFGAKVIIDATNIGALQFYNLITPASSSDSRTKNSNVKGLTGQFMNLFNLQSIYGNDDKTSTDGVLNSVAKSAGGEYDQSGTWWRIVKLCVFGIIFIIAVTVVFAAGSILFLSRTITLFFLMLFASLAVASRALPATKGQFDSWLKKLINNAIFAPIFLGLIYIFVSATSNVEKGGNLADIILTGGNISAIVTFLMYLAFLVGLLLVAKQLGIKGGDAAHGFADKWLSPKSIGNRALGGAKMVGRGALTVGKGSLNATLGAGKYLKNMAADSNLVKKAAGYVPRIFGGGALRENLATSAKANQDRIKKNATTRQKEYEYVAKFNPDPKKSDAENELAENAFKLNARRKVLGVDADGKNINAAWYNPLRWSRLERFVGGQGAKDAIKAVTKKDKAEAKSAARKHANTIDAILGVENLTGNGTFVKKPNVNDPKTYTIEGDEDLYKLSGALQRKEDFTNVGGELKLGGVVIDVTSPLGMAYSDYIMHGKNKDDENHLNQVRKDLASRIKTWSDIMDKEDKDAQRDEKAKKDDSKTNPKP
ncbi:MAG: type IV secretion system protein [bacterium]